jgi:hypothetical protein
MYMVQQRVTTAVREGYGEAEPAEVRRQLERAHAAREWLAVLAIEPEVRAWLVEPIEAVEEALAETLRRRTADG